MDGDGIQNGIRYALGDERPVILTNPRGLQYSLRDKIEDLGNNRVELSTDLKNWRHNVNGGNPVTRDLSVAGPPRAEFRLIRGEALSPLDSACRLYLRIVMP